MARPIYQHELHDPDFSWLIQRFQESNPEYLLVESTVLPVVFVRGEPSHAIGNLPMVLTGDEDRGDDAELPGDVES